MKTLLLTLLTLALTSTGIHAQSFSDPETQKLMREAQTCYENMDPSVFTKLQTRAENMQKELKRLCDAGKDKEALQKAMGYARDFNNSPEMEEMQKCASIARKLLEKLPFPVFPDPVEPIKEDYEDGTSACDAI